ncbi:hypothetical protein [Humibacter ginsengisoli]
MQKSHRKLTATVAVSLALLVTTSLAGCSAWAGSRQGYLVFDDKGEAVSEGGKDVPAWLPDDATGITLDYPATGSGYLMKFASAAGVPVSASCAVGPENEPLKPTISADWWPKQPLTTDRRVCGATQVARLGNEWYAWANGS